MKKDYSTEDMACILSIVLFFIFIGSVVLAAIDYTQSQNKHKNIQVVIPYEHLEIQKGDKYIVRKCISNGQTFIELEFVNP